MKRLKTKILVTGAIISLYGLSFSSKNLPDNSTKFLPNTVVLKWNEAAYQAFGGSSYQHSLMASRINAMTHIAIHDALNAVQPKYATYVFTGKDAGADPIAAAAVAAHTVLLHEIPDKKNFLDSVLRVSLSEIKQGTGKTRGIRLGKQAAQAIINARLDDGSAGELVKQVAPSTTAGVYQVVPPFNVIFVPHWENVKLFGLERKDQFRSAPHPSLTGDKYAMAFNEVKLVGKLNSTIRTTDETAYTKFWYEFSEAGWNRVARTVAINKKLNLFETARMFALVDMALADSYIAGWDAKLYYNFWRPYTAIRKAAIDENKNTVEDLQWEPSASTPPIQDYPSTHSVLGNAGAVVLSTLLGDNTAFTMTSPTAFPVGSTRSFTSFSQAANENADSRVKGGIHFRFSCEAGQEMGNKIGNWIVANYLKPLK